MKRRGEKRKTQPPGIKRGTSGPVKRPFRDSGRLVLLSCLAATGLAHLPSLGNHLVADSWVFMMPHSFLDNFTYFFKTMLPPEFNALWLRPIPMFTFWFDTVVWPGTEWGPHLTNLLFHLLNVWLIFRLFRFIRPEGEGDSGKTAASLPVFTACLVYGLHPLTVGAVGWVAARFDVMSVTFGLSGTLFWLKWLRREGGKRTLPASLLMLSLGLFSKEQGIVFIGACFAAGLHGLLAPPDGRRRGAAGLAALSLLVVGYGLFRISVFKGMGGYLEARHGLSALPPLYYLAALLFPYGNVVSNPELSPAFFAAAAVVVATVFFLRGVPERHGGIHGAYVACAAAICVFGLATNAPNPGMTLEMVMGHAESRFALNAIAGLALLAGAAVDRLSASPRMYRLAAVAVTVWGVSAAWRTDVQIQAWRRAGEKAAGIMEDTIRLAPHPPPGSRLLFFGVPRNNEQWAYIFGIGLKEALLSRYGRKDIDIVRYPTREDLRAARPERDFVFRYDPVTGRLERLTAHRKKEGTPHGGR